MKTQCKWKTPAENACTEQKSAIPRACWSLCLHDAGRVRTPTEAAVTESDWFHCRYGLSLSPRETRGPCFPVTGHRRAGRRSDRAILHPRAAEVRLARGLVLSTGKQWQSRPWWQGAEDAQSPEHRGRTSAPALPGHTCKANTGVHGDRGPCCGSDSKVADSLQAHGEKWEGR